MRYLLMKSEPDEFSIDDLARAHLSALDYLRGGGATVTLNCGYGHGYSVREVIAAAESVGFARALPTLQDESGLALV